MHWLGLFCNTPVHGILDSIDALLLLKHQCVIILRIFANFVQLKTFATRYFPCSGDFSVLIWIISSLSCKTIRLIIHWFPGHQIAVLKHRCRVAEDKINCAVNVAFPVELSKRVCVESVLVAFEAAAVEC